MNIWDILILTAIASVLIGAVLRIRKGKKCSGGCGNCPYSDGCRKK